MKNRIAAILFLLTVIALLTSCTTKQSSDGQEQNADQEDNAEVMATNNSMPDAGENETLQMIETKLSEQLGESDVSVNENGSLIQIDVFDGPGATAAATQKVDGNPDAWDAYIEKFLTIYSGLPDIVSGTEYEDKNFSLKVSDGVDNYLNILNGKVAFDATDHDFEYKEANGPEITLAEFNQIKTGMTYSEVIKIVGSEGSEVSTASYGGYTTTIYSWSGNGQLGSNAVITFTNNSVEGKVQVLLE